MVSGARTGGRILRSPQIDAQSLDFGLRDSLTRCCRTNPADAASLHAKSGSALTGGIGKRTIHPARDTPWTIAQVNVDIVRRALDGFLSAGYDLRNVEDFFEVVDPGIEFDISRTNPETEVYRGRDGIIEGLEQWIGTWDAYEAEAVELIDIAPDCVVTVIRERGRLKGSDAWVEHTRGAVWKLKDQRITRYEEHQDRAKALEAAGLKQ